MATRTEKTVQANDLIAKVKAMNAEGIDSGEKATQARAMIAQAQTLMSEVKAENETIEKSQLNELLEAYEAQHKGTPAAPTSAALITPDADVMKGADDEFALGWTTPKSRIMFSAKSAETAAWLKNPRLGMKVLNEGSGGGGNFLVPPDYAQDLFAETRRQGNALRRYGWMAIHGTNSDQVLFPVGGGAASFGIVGEGQAAPTSDQTFTQVSVPIYKGIGISNLSNEFSDDSDPSGAGLVFTELGSLAGNYEELKIINGSGTGEPLGILNTSGTNAISAATNTAQAIIDAILDGIVQVQTNAFKQPTGILMHPRRYGFLLKGKDTANNYLINRPGAFRAPASMPNGVTSVTTGGMQEMGDILGLPVGLSANIPTTLSSNRDCIIVGDWTQLHWWQRQDVTVDVTTVGGNAFENDLAKYRLKERFGLSAARYPASFSILTGAGLVP